MKPEVVLVASILILGVLGAMATCDPQMGSNSISSGVYCVVMADSPAEQDDSGRITGAARYYCDNPGASLSLTVQLQKQRSNGDWSTVAKKSFTVSAKSSVRTDEKRYHLQGVSVGCSEGAFRTIVTGKSSAEGETNKYDHTSPRSNDPC